MLVQTGGTGLAVVLGDPQEDPMIWMMTATAALLPASEPDPVELAPLERAWGGTEDCDVRAVMVEAGQRVVEPADGHTDPQAMLMHNLHVLEAWERVRGCRTMERGFDGIFQLYSAGRVLVASARSQVASDPVRAAEDALDAFAFGHDASAGPLLATMVGQAVHLDALDVLGEVWPALTAAEQARFARRLEALNRVRPPLDVEAERAMAVDIASLHWMEGACLQAHDEAMDHAMRALEAGDPSLLQDRRTPSWAEWFTGCGLGIESVTADYLEAEADMERSIAELVD
jgi:hypothetical protein